MPGKNGEGVVVDFGMARQLESGQQSGAESDFQADLDRYASRTESDAYARTGGKEHGPVYWMAPEALESGKYEERTVFAHVYLYMCMFG
jgi:hypothetical protein